MPMEMQQGLPWIDRWVHLDTIAHGGAQFYVTPPEFDIPLDNALNIAITLEVTGVGAACGVTGPRIEVERTTATTDIDGAWTSFGTVVDNVLRKRYSVSKVFGQNNADLASLYGRGLMRLKITNVSSTNVAFVRIRAWVDIQYADGSHATALQLLASNAIAPDSAAGHPELWFDDFVFLDPSQAWAMPAPLFLPMNKNTEAFYTVDWAAMGLGAGKVDFQRTAMPTEKDAAWQTMNGSVLPMATGSMGYINKSFAEEGVVANEHPARGYQRALLTNTDAVATHWTSLRVRIWAHLS